MTVAVVIPCYRVRRQILGVLGSIGPEVSKIYVVDDCCPEKTGDLVESECTDPRVRVVRNTKNLGVGGATISGYRAALADSSDIVVKLDGDGQMDPRNISALVHSIVDSKADYAKGNRFFTLESLKQMPWKRKLGNILLSFLNKLTSGYWNLMDPTNGFTAIHSEALRAIPMEKLDKRYFFESDMLFRLNTIRAVVAEVAMDSVYGDEKSNMQLKSICLTFPGKHLVRFVKRIFYTYFLRDFNPCSIQIIIGSALLGFGSVFGFAKWYASISSGIASPSGTVMLAALPVIVGIQLLAAAVNFDVLNIPRNPIHPILLRQKGLKNKKVAFIPRDEAAAG